MSTFTKLSLNREVCDWTEHLKDLTPVEKHGGTWLKREDLFAPLGDGGINGSKLRGCILMLKNRFEAGATRIYTGASVLSPQHSMTAAVSYHLGMDTVHIIGATKAETAIRHVQIQMAGWFGAKFHIVPVGYNSVLQGTVEKFHAADSESSVMPYGISPQGDKEILEFHHLGGLQVANLPDVETLLIPAGSCNSLASILYGLQINNRPSSLKRIITVGIGPDRLKWVWERLKALGVNDGYRYHGPAPSALAKAPQSRNYLEIVHLDAQGEGFCSYQDRMPESIGEVELHPTYEGKVRRYMMQKYPDVMDDRCCLWIVGGQATAAAMLPAIGDELGNQPHKLPIQEMVNDLPVF